MNDISDARSIAFYLPQYHPIPENDEWWGRGFTEWTNVTRAQPLFRNHKQPHLPADLGFYDLRTPESRAQQAEFASSYGVGAFCYWHYWFGGRTLLERPLEDVVRSGEPDLPFCIGWANQTWTGIWHGAADRVLVDQTYPGDADNVAHFRYLMPALTDERYITVGGKPLVYIFRPEELPEPRRFIELWQRLALEAGLPGLYFVAEVSDLLGAGPKYTTFEDDGFDAGVYVRMPVEVRAISRLRMRFRRGFLGHPEVYPFAPRLARVPDSLAGAKTLPCVYPNWDNTPRSGKNGLVISGTTPSGFEAQLREAVDRVSGLSSQERLVFVKSWNEWAEGNHLEPDVDEGRAWLEAHRRVFAA